MTRRACILKGSTGDSASNDADVQPVHVPSEENLISEILSVVTENPNFGFRRVHQAVKDRRPEWAVRDARIRSLLQRLRASQAIAPPPTEPVVSIERSAAERMESLYTQSSQSPSSYFDVTDEGNDEGTSTPQAEPCPTLEGLRAPPRRDALIDAARAYGDRFSELLELERTHQASEVLERLRAWSTARLEREGLAVTSLVANPGVARCPLCVVYRVSETYSLDIARLS